MKYHPITQETQKIIRDVLGDTDEWDRIARDAGVSTRTLYAIASGPLKEMRLTKALSLARACGIKVSFRLPKRPRGARGKQAPAAQPRQ